MIVSAIGFTVAAQTAGAREEVLVLARDVPLGQVLRPGDLRVVEVAASGGVVPVTDRDAVLRRRAKVPLVAGSLLAPEQLGTNISFPPKGFSQVALAVAPGDAPPDLDRGERVALLAGPASTSAGTAVEAAGPDPTVTGTVTGVRAPEAAGGPRVISVLVETAAARQTARLEHPRLAVLPAEGREAP